MTGRQGTDRLRRTRSTVLAVLAVVCVVAVVVVAAWSLSPRAPAIDRVVVGTATPTPVPSP